MVVIISAEIIAEPELNQRLSLGGKRFERWLADITGKSLLSRENIKTYLQMGEMSRL
jgi:hypothetical protein